MKYINTYKNLKLNNNNEEIFDYFISTLNKSLYTWDYFVDWKKIQKNISNIEKELNILNYLLGKDNVGKEFFKLLQKYPSIRKVLPVLIALRLDKIKNLNILDEIESLDCVDISDIFDPTNSIINEEKVDNFFMKTGLNTIFENKKINNLVDYCYGIEVGMDVNARKNRTGILMEKIITTHIKNFAEKFEFAYSAQVNSINLKAKFGISLNSVRYDRKFDFALYNKKNKLFLFEVNYYSGGGSKLKATAGEYQDVSRLLKNQNVEFIWITDGIGWHTSKNPLFEAFKELDYLFNLSMLTSGVLAEVIL
jgi:type II restriction enzyme